MRDATRNTTEGRISGYLAHQTYVVTLYIELILVTTLSLVVSHRLLTGLDPRQLSVGLVVDKVALRQDAFRVILCYSVIAMPPMLHINFR
jgi:hypothetical protein